MRINFKTVKQFVAISVLMKSIVACSSDDLFLGGSSPDGTTKGDPNVPVISEIYNDSTKNGVIVLSEKPLGNPYNIDTLKKAYAFLSKTGKVRAAMPDFAPTHYQLRFLPADSLEFRKLMTSGLVFTTLPLDKHIAEEGTYYFDPQLKAQGVPYTWQYTLVPVTEQLPDVRHEVIAEICAAPNDGLRGCSADLLSDVWPALELKAHEMCGQTPPSKIQSRVGGAPGMPGEVGKYILVWDDHANQYIPVKGAYILAFGDTWSASTMTDEKGSYENLKVNGPITRMAIQWQDASNNWVIYDGESGEEIRYQAIYACSSSEPKFTYRIKGGKQQTFAVTTRVLQRFYNEYNSCLPVPLPGLTVFCIDGYSPDKYAGLFSPGNVVRVWGKDESGASRWTTTLFSSMAHELGHYIYYHNIISNTKNWNKTENIIKESWARCVEWLVLEYEYNHLSDILGCTGQLSFVQSESLPYWGVSGSPGQTAKLYSKPTEYNHQKWPFEYLQLPANEINKRYLSYSPLFIDLFDRDNQADYYRAYGIKNHWQPDAYKSFPDDKVSDYLTSQIISALRSATDLEQLKENIKNARMNSEADKIKIDNLFNLYVYYWEKYK